MGHFRLWLTILMLLPSGMSRLSAQEQPFGDTLTELEIIGALAKYRNDWIAIGGKHLVDCNLHEAIINVNPYDSAEYLQLTASIGISESDKKANRIFKWMYLNALSLDKKPIKWSKLKREHPAIENFTDSTSLQACLFGYSLGKGLFWNKIIDKKPPFKLNLDSTIIHEEILAFKFRRGERIADIGTGDGTIPHILTYLGFTVTAQDLWYESIYLNNLKDHMPIDIARNFWVTKGNKKDAKLPDNEFHTILIRNAFHHFKKPEEMMNSLTKSLRTGGRIIIADSYTDLTDHTDSCPRKQKYHVHKQYLTQAGYTLTREFSINEKWFITEWQRI